MEMRALASMIAKREGKKHQASVGDVREILSILQKIDLETSGLVHRLLIKSYGAKAKSFAKKRRKKK